MTTINPKAPILITGASGYVAGWIVKNLLETGHTVHATVRDPAKTKSVAHLQKIADNSTGTLKLFKADLLDEGAFDEAMAGCELVLHTASPFIISGYKDAYEALVRPALEGTRNVFASIERTPSVKRVVLTSSVVATYGDNQDAANLPNATLNESHWNTSSSVDHQPYNYSKTVAERDAWKLHGEQSQPNRWDLVCVNPGLVVGPALTTNSVSASITTLQQFGDGTMRFGAPHMLNGLVDVRDVADAHIRAGFTPEANGRYIICGDTISLLQMGSALRQKFGSKYPFPLMPAPKLAFWTIAPLFGMTRDFVARNVGHKINFDNGRSQRDLKIEYRDVRNAICEHFQQLIDDGLIKKRA
jgi:nucleoside-diphosphate-sugar epimerase